RPRIALGAHRPLKEKHAASLQIVLQGVQQSLVVRFRPTEVVADHKHRHSSSPLESVPRASRVCSSRVGQNLCFHKIVRPPTITSEGRTLAHCPSKAARHNT